MCMFHFTFFARQIGIFAVFTHFRYFYLRYSVPTHEKNKQSEDNGHHVMLKWRQSDMSHFSVFSNFLKLFVNIKKLF